MTFKNLKIRAKLLIGFMTIALLVGVVGLISINNFKIISEPFEKAREEFVPAVLAIENMRHSSGRMTLALYKYLLYDKEEYKIGFEVAVTEAAEILELYESAEAGEEAKIIESFEQHIAALSNLGRQIIQLKEQGGAKEAVLLEGEKFHEAHQLFQIALGEEIDRDYEDLAQVFTEVERTVDQGVRAILFAAVFIFALAIVLGYFISRSISKPILGIRDAAAKIAQGDIDVTIKPRSNDEIGELAVTFNKMIKDLERSRSALEEAKVVLEIKVRARTKELKDLSESLEQQVKERTKEIQGRMNELERFQKLVIGRELKMIELKKELKKLKKEFKKKS